MKRGDIVFWAVEPGYRFFAHPIMHVEWKFYTANHTSSNPATLANLQGRENGCSWMNMIWGVLYQVNDTPFHGQIQEVAGSV